MCRAKPHGRREHIPDWVHDAVIYHVLVDRFAADGGRPLHVEGPLPWLGFVGGTLRGLTARLDHVVELGANTLLVSPISPASMHVCYDHTDLFDVDPRLGSLDDARALCREAHRLGLRVLLDIELCYFGSAHPFVRDAVTGDESPYRSWFRWRPDDRPVGWRSSQRFAAIDHASPDARAHLLDGVRFWLDVGFDGFRCDSAHQAPISFWDEFGAALAAHAPEAFAFGEVTLAAGDRRAYTGLHSTLAFDVHYALRGFCDGSIPVSVFAQRIAEARTGEPTFAESHDVDRLDLVCRHDRERLELALLLLLTLPGPPILYYGTEVGMGQEETGDPDLVARWPMPWGSAQDRELFETVGALVRMRQEHVALRRGSVRTLHVDDPGVVAFAREHPDGDVIVAANAGDEPAPVSLSSSGSGRTDLHVIHGAHDEMETADGTVRIRLPAGSGCVLVRPHDG